MLIAATLWSTGWQALAETQPVALENEALTHTQTPTKSVTLRERGISVEDALARVKQLAGVFIMYETAVIDKELRISLDLKKASVREALDEICSKAGLKYEIVDNHVLVTRAVRSAANSAQRVPETETEAASASASVVEAQQQQRGAGQHIYRGTVTDESGEPLIGVSVVVKGAAKGVATDAEGAFTLPYDADEVTLVFSYIGMQSREVKATSRSGYLNITLTTDELMIQEVVVTGYQSISKERATGSFDILSRTNIEKPTTSIGTALIGTVAGLSATVDANGNPTFEIRGQTRLSYDTGDNAPLVVVDGFAVERSFSDINPNDVKSITVLKDAAAASIWGARAGNGVIVITTKEGARKGLTVEGSSFVRIAPKLDLDYLRSMATSAEMLEYEKRAFYKWSAPLFAINDSYSSHTATTPGISAMYEHYFGHISEAERDALMSSYAKLDNSAQIRKYLLQNPLTRQHSVEISSANDRITNRLSLLYEGQDSYLAGNSNEKFSANYRMNASLFKWLDINFSGNYTRNKETFNNPNTPGMTTSTGVTEIGVNTITGIAPYEMLVDETGNRLNISTGLYMPNLERYVPMSSFPYADWTYNPITEIESRDFTRLTTTARAQGGFTFKIIDGLTITSQGQYESVSSQTRKYYKEGSYVSRYMVNTSSTWDQTSGKITQNLPKGGILNQIRNQTNVWYVRNQLNLDRTFAERHSVTLVGGSEVSSRVSEYFENPTTYGYDDATLAVGTFPNGPGGTFAQIKNWLGSNQTFAYVNKFTYATDRFFSLYGNLAYTYDGKYTLSGSARTDASNLITDDPAYRYAPFWSIGGSWQATNEEFMKPITWLDRLNLRLTYGYNGNVDKSTSFRPLLSMSATPDTWTQERNGTVSSFGNPMLRWEKTATWNFGIDYAILGHKLSGKIDLYNKNSTDLIASMSIPAYNGTTTQKLNMGSMLNRGVEVEISMSQPITSDRKITWLGTLTAAYNYNKITSFFKSSYQGYELINMGGSYVTAAYREGYNAQTLWCYEYAGIRNDGTEENPDWQPKIKGKDDDVYGFGSWPPGDGRDYTVNMGTKVAPYVIGFSNEFKIYDFDLQLLFTGKFGHKFMRQSFNYPQAAGRALANRQYSEIANADPMERVPLPMKDNEDRYYFWDRFYPYLSYLAEDASHVRFREAVLSYNLPSRLMQRAGIARLQLYTQVTNILNIYANSYGEDPEYPRGSLSSMKPQPTYTLGLKLQF
jgi:TonB-linked SusC/RagA family outer membrane protein